MSVQALKERARKLRTKVANARQKGRDNKAASAELKRLENLIRQKTK